MESDSRLRQGPFPDAKEWDGMRKCTMRYNGTGERAEGKSMYNQMNRSRSNPSRAAVDGEAAKSLTNAARTFWLPQSPTKL